MTNNEWELNKIQFNETFCQTIPNLRIETEDQIIWKIRTISANVEKCDAFCNVQVCQMSYCCEQRGISVCWKIHSLTSDEWSWERQRYDDRCNTDNSDSKHIHNTKRFNARYKTSIELIRAWKTAHGAHKWKPAFRQRVSHVPNTEWKISFPLTFEAIASDLSKANTSNILIRARDNFSFQFKYR